MGCKILAHYFVKKNTRLYKILKEWRRLESTRGKRKKIKIVVKETHFILKDESLCTYWKDCPHLTDIFFQLLCE
jgi:hypothetical protein